MVKKELKRCLKKYDAKIPAQLDGKEEVTHWGSIVGACAAQGAEQKFVSEKEITSSPACDAYKKNELPAIRSRAYTQLRDVDPELAQKIKGQPNH